MNSTEDGADRKGRSTALILAIIAPAALALLVMLPRLLSPQFGLFDDGVTLVTVRQILAGDGGMWEFELGRFRPTYWLYWLALELIATGSPFIYFLGNLALLLATSVLITIALVKSDIRGGVAALAGSLFVLSGPVVENYYTLSKAEPIQVFLLALSLVLLVSIQEKHDGGISVWRLFAVAAILLLAMGAKETTVAIVPVSAVWLILAVLARKRGNNIAGVKLSAAYLGCGMAAAAAYAAIRWAAFGIPLYGAGYTHRYSLDLASLLPALVRWLAWTSRLFPYLAPVAILAAISWRFRRSEAAGAVLIASTVWMMGWLAIIIPWTVSAGYFLLPFGVGAAVLTAVVLDSTWTMINGIQGSLRSIGIALIATTAVLIAVVIVNGTSMARLQLAVDRANHQAIEWLQAEVPEGARVLVNIQTENEYLDEIGIHLNNLYNRPDIQVAAFQNPGDLATASDESVYILAPEVEDQMAFSVRHGVIESSLERWNRELHQALPEATALAFKIIEDHRLIDIALLRIACPLDDSLLYCEGSRPLIDLLRYRYGWRVYAVK